VAICARPCVSTLWRQFGKQMEHSVAAALGNCFVDFYDLVWGKAFTSKRLPLCKTHIPRNISDRNDVTSASFRKVGVVIVDFVPKLGSFGSITREQPTGTSWQKERWGNVIFHGSRSNLRNCDSTVGVAFPNESCRKAARGQPVPGSCRNSSKGPDDALLRPGGPKPVKLWPTSPAGSQPDGAVVG